MIKLIALDLDGTLLDSQKRLSQRNEEVLKECIRRGIHIVPCTGRIWKGIPEVIRTIPGIQYAITINGAVVEDVVNQRVLYERKMSLAQGIEILELAKQFDVMYDAYVDGQGYGEARFMEHMELYGVLPAIRQMVRDTRIVVPDLIETLKELKRPVEKVNYFFGNQSERKRARAALEARGDMIITSSFANNLEINLQGAAKGEGIRYLAQYLGLKLEETMGFGDGENDISMMRLAGIGVAMENGEDSVKAEADYVTDTNDADGVAKAIEKFVLNV